MAPQGIPERASDRNATSQERPQFPHRRVEHPRFHKAETIYLNAHVHLLRITEPAELDEEVAAWLREAYAVGCQKHLAVG